MKKLLIALVCLAACATTTVVDPVPASSSTLTGAWTGTIVVQPVTTVNLYLNDVGGNVEAAGTITNDSPVSLYGTGLFENSTFSITLFPDAFSPMNMTARLVGTDSLFGVVNGSGFVNDTIGLKKVIK